MERFICLLVLSLALVGDTFPQSNIVKAPDFQLVDLHGDIVSMQDYQGKYLVIHIATTWCPYCNAEAPYLEELYREYLDKNVGVLIIDVREPKELIASKLQDRFQLSFPILLDSEGTVAASFAPPEVLPELARDEIMLASNILVDPNGHIQYMSLLDTRNFDSKLIHIKEKLNELLQEN
ncbi:MAG: redoxin domain-containing protein [Saprospiraceae bacterium]|nr:redoxin domain-containing protein [Saprospiraceae bacterium]